jgi:flagellar biosynthesis/type III secretory pathway protein FliH
MWEIREKDSRFGRRMNMKEDKSLEEAYECGYEDGYEAAMEEMEEEHKFGSRSSYGRRRM